MGTHSCRDCIHHNILPNKDNTGLIEWCGTWPYKIQTECKYKKTKAPERWWTDENRWE